MKDLEFNNAPNWLTFARILFVPIVVFALFKQTPDWDFAAGILFSIAGITDYFDGYLARTRKQETVFGKLLDPLADKFLVVSSLVMLQYLGRIHPVIVILLICREMAITGLRAMASAEGLIIGASKSAKWKTTAQMVAIPWIMVKSTEPLGFALEPAGMILLYTSLVISLWSAKDYVVDFFVKIREKRLQRKSARQEKKKLKRQR